jgi:hypothetical protein
MALFAIMAAMSRTKKLLGRSLLRLSLLISAFTVLLSSQRADAGLLEIWADGYVGGMYGTEPKFCTNCVTQSPTGRGADFFHDQSGGLIGARAGIEILYTDIYLQFDQFLTPRAFSGSTLQAMLGWDMGLGAGDWRGTLGIFGGMIFGFPYSAANGIDLSQVQKIGVTAELQGGPEYIINRFLTAQILGTIGYHYMFSGASAVSAAPGYGYADSIPSTGFHLMLKVGLRFHIGI